jgi:hypothetical protein
MAYGITPEFADVLLASLNGSRPRVAIVCAQIHNGAPGKDGTLNVAATQRQEMTCAAPSNGSISLTGGQPSWDIVSRDTISGVSLWSGLDGDQSAYCLFTLPASPPVLVTQGDLLILNTCALEWVPAATGGWVEVGTVEPPTATGSGSMLVATITGSAVLTAALMSGSGSMLVPSIAILYPVPTATGSGSMLVPTVSGSATITAPLMTGSGSMLVPTITITPNTYQDQLNVAVTRTATW